MAKSPFYKVKVKGTDTDITNMVTGLKYEDCLEEDDMLDLKLDGVTIPFIDSGEIKKGVELIFEYGFIGGKRSGQRYAVIKNLDYTYGSTVSIGVKAHDKGTWLKKQTSKQIYENKTGSEIVKAIADMFGMESVIDDTETVYETIPQAGKTFFEFIKYLAGKEGYVKTDSIFGNKNSSAIQELNNIAQSRFGISGFYAQAITITGRNALREKYKNDPNFPTMLIGFEKAIAINEVTNVGKTYIKGAYEFFIRGNKLHFVKKDLSGDSKRTFVFGDPDGPVISFKPKTREEGNGSGKSAGINSGGINPDTNEVINVKSDSTNTNETGLGDNLLHFDVNGVLKQSTNILPNLITGGNDYSTGNNETEIKKKVSSKKLKSSKKEVTATLVIEMDPDVNAGDIITMAGVAQIHCGNWRVEKAANDVTGSALTTLEMSKNAGKGGQGGGTGTATNNTTGTNGNNGGGDENEKGLDRVYFDNDGNEIGTKEKGYGLKTGNNGARDINKKINNR